MKKNIAIFLVFSIIVATTGMTGVAIDTESTVFSKTSWAFVQEQNPDAALGTSGGAQKVRTSLSNATVEAGVNDFAYLKFEVGDTTDIAKVELEFKAYWDGTSVELATYKVENNTFDNNTTYNTRPDKDSADGEKLAFTRDESYSHGEEQYYKFYKVDVTKFFKDDADGIVTVKLKGERNVPNSARYIWMYLNNSDTSFNPVIKVTYDLVPTVSGIGMKYDALVDGFNVEAIYDFSHNFYKEGNSEIKWYMADDDAGTNETTIDLSKIDPTSEKGEILNIDEDLQGKYISFKVKPYTIEGIHSEDGECADEIATYQSLWVGPVNSKSDYDTRIYNYFSSIDDDNITLETVNETIEFLSDSNEVFNLDLESLNGLQDTIKAQIITRLIKQKPSTIETLGSEFKNAFSIVTLNNSESLTDVEIAAIINDLAVANLLDIERYNNLQDLVACAGLMKNYGEYEDFDDIQRALDKCVAIQEIKETLDSDCFWEKLIEHDNLLELGIQEMNYWLAKPASSVVFSERNEVYGVEELIDKIEVAIEELNSTYEPVEFEREKLFFDDSLLVTVIYDESDVMYDSTKPLPQRKLGNAVTGNDPRTNRYVLFGSKNGINRKVIAMFRVDIPKINESPLHEVTLNMSAYRLSKDYNVDIYVADDFVDSENPNMSAVNDIGETLDKTSLGYMYFPFYPNLEQRTLNLTDYVKSLHEAGKETLCISVYANAPGAITSPSDGLHLWMENNPDTPHDDRPYVEVSYETKPTVKNVKIDGAVAVNEKLKASYDYYGIYPEGNSRIQWFKADDALGTNETLISEEKEINVGTELVGKYIRCGIIPVSSGGNAGNGYIAYSNYAGAVTSVPVAQGIISNINTIDNRDDLSNYLTNNNNVLLIDLEMKGISVELKNNVFDGIIARNFTTLGEFRKYVDQMVNVQFLNTAVDEAAILSLIQTADFGINSETLARYDAYQDKSFVNSRLLNKGFTSPESAKAAFEESCCLFEFSSISFDNVTERLLAYDYLFDNKVKELSENQEKLTLAGNMYISNTINGVTTFTDIKNAVINAVSGAINYQPSLEVPEGGTVGGGSSGGGFGGGIGSVAIGKTESPSVAPTPVEIKAFKDIDVVENWAGKAITELYKQGVINGVGEGKFEPNRVLYREEFVKMMVEAFDINVETKINFTDVDEDDWCYSYIEKAVASGIIQGVDETSFGAGTPLSRQDLSVIIYRLFMYLNKTTDTTPDVVFDDNGEISDYAKDAVNMVVNSKIMNGVGDNKFAPLESTTRAMAAVVIYNALCLTK